MMLKKIILIISLLFSMAYANRIIFEREPEEFSLFNRETGRILRYYRLDPGETMRVRIIEVETLEVYSRLIINAESGEDYQYSFRSNKEERIVNRSVGNLSTETRGLAGEQISQFNLFTYTSEEREERITIKNISEIPILFRLDADNIPSGRQRIGYVSYTPQKYGEIVTLKVNEDTYTYFRADDDNRVEFTLKGPIYVKIISRLVYDNPLVNSYSYRYNVYSNGELMTTYHETAFKSYAAYFPDNMEITPSSGDVNILEFPEGIHHIIIEDPDVNRDLIFNFYISKSAIGVIEE